MSFLSATDLSQMRADVANMLPDIGTISAVTLVSDGAGGETQVWAAIGTVACRVDPVPPYRLEMIEAAEGFRYEYMITMGYSAVIAAGNTIATGGFTYELRDLHNMHSWNVSVRAKVVRIV